MRVLLAAAPHRDTFGYSMPPPGLLRLAGELLRRGIAVEIEDLALRLSAGELACDDRLADAAADLLLERAVGFGGTHAESATLKTSDARARSIRLAAKTPENAELHDAIVMRDASIMGDDSDVRGASDVRDPFEMRDGFAGSDAFVIGISVMGATLPIALAILARLRRRMPRAQLWLGGPGTTGVDAAILERFPFVDVVVRGEGELTVPELCAAVGEAREPRGVHGITWRDEQGRVQREPDREPVRDLADLAPYAWHLLPPLSVYKRITGEADGLVPLDSGRGCVYDCSFCTIGRFWSRRSRTVPAKMLADEVASLRSIPAAKSAYLCHDIFGANRGQAVAFCEEMLRRGIDVPWEVRARADHLDRDLLELMGRAGCYRVLIGVESADAEVRARNQKGMRADVDMLAVVDDCARSGITPILSLILGLPGENEVALRKSLDLCAAASLRAGVNVSLHLVNPQPGCGLGEEFGRASRPIEGIPPDMAFGAGETAAERALIAAHPDLFSTWSLLPLEEAHLRDLHSIATTLPDVLMRYPRTFALLGARRSRDALDTFRAWRAGGRSFEGFVGAERDPVLDDALRWEQALVRQSTQTGATDPVAQVDGQDPVDSARLDAINDDSRGPRPRGEVVALDHDLPRICDELRSGASSPSCEPRRTMLCVVPMTRSKLGSRAARGIETLRISSDVARILSELDGTESLPMLESRMPGIAAALERLAAAGLVELAISAAPLHDPTDCEPTNEMQRA